MELDVSVSSLTYGQGLSMTLYQTISDYATNKALSVFFDLGKTGRAGVACPIDVAIGLSRFIPLSSPSSTRFGQTGALGFSPLDHRFRSATPDGVGHLSLPAACSNGECKACRRFSRSSPSTAQPLP